LPLPSSPKNPPTNIVDGMVITNLLLERKAFFAEVSREGIGGGSRGSGGRNYPGKLQRARY
jgi:hypothetical protein